MALHYNCEAYAIYEGMSNILESMETKADVWKGMMAWSKEETS